MSSIISKMYKPSLPSGAHLWTTCRPNILTTNPGKFAFDRAMADGDNSVVIGEILR